MVAELVSGPARLPSSFPLSLPSRQAMEHPNARVAAQEDAGFTGTLEIVMKAMALPVAADVVIQAGTQMWPSRKKTTTSIAKETLEIVKTPDMESPFDKSADKFQQATDQQTRRQRQTTKQQTRHRQQSYDRLKNCNRPLNRTK